jgi:hypothetical protein
MVYKAQAVQRTSHNDKTNKFGYNMKNRLDPKSNLACMPELILKKLFKLPIYIVCNKMTEAYIYCALSTIG